MISKNEIKYIQSLSHKKTRDEEGMFIAEGTKLVNELLESDIVVKKIYATEEWVNEHSNLQNVIKVQEDELKKISKQSAPNHVLAIAEQKKLITEPFVKNSITLVLDAIQDPGNLGTIIRIADWFAIPQIICSHDCADVYNPKVVQATMGSIARVKVFYTALPEWIKQQGKIRVYVTMLEGKNVTKMNSLTEGL